MLNFPAELLLITDGTTTFDLLARGRGTFWCYNWVPAVAEAKGGGAWRDSPLAEGRTPAYRQFGNIIDSFDISATSFTQDALARDVDRLRYLLEKAVKYWVSKQPGKYVWIEARGAKEENTRYATIIDYRTPSDGNPYDDPFAKIVSPRAAFDPWTLVIEHTHWMEQPPGTTTCVETSAQQEDWHYEPEWALNSNQMAASVAYPMRWFEECGYLFVGGNGTNWRTNNPVPANNWTSHATAANYWTYDIMRADDGTLYAATYRGGVGGRTYSSGDCGNTWALFNPGGVNRGARRMGSLCMGGDGRVYLITDVDVATPSVLSFPLTGAVGWTVEATDATWSSVRGLVELGAGSAAPGRQIMCVQNDNSEGEIWITDDYWTTRERTLVLAHPTTGFALAAPFITSSHLILVGSNYTDVYASVDGIHWELVGNTGVGGTARSINAFAEDDEGIVRCTATTEYAGISGDGGHTWSRHIVSTTRDYTIGICWSDVYGWFVSMWDSTLTNGNVFALDNITTLGRSATCDDEVFIVNHRSERNLTHVKVHNFGTSYTDEFPAAAFSFDLLPGGGTAVDDAIYFGIDTDLQTFGDPPHDNLVFDIDTPAYDLSLRWEYWNGTWAILTVHDGTDAGMGPLTRSGVNSVSWVPPSDWTTVAVDGTTALWVRCYVYGAPGANEVIPTQQNRDVYTTIWPRIDVAADQVPGTIMALGRHLLTMRSDEDGYNGDRPELWSNRVIMGLRKMERGGVDCSDFTAYLNCADEQNPVGIECSLGAATSFVNYLDHAPGRAAEYYPAGVQSMAMRVRFEMEGELARQYHGAYHAFVRLKHVNAAFGTVSLRLYVGSPWGSNEYWTKIKVLTDTDEYTKLIDLGSVDLPLARVLRPDEYPGTTRLEIHASCSDAVSGTVKTLAEWMASDILAPYDTAREGGVNPTDFEHWTTQQLWYDGLTDIADSPIIYFYDLILIPTDEWYGDFTDDVLSATTMLKNGYYFDLDSIRNPRENLRPLVFNAATGAEMSNYEPQSPGPALLNPLEQQRMWYLFDKSNATGTAAWDCSPHILLSSRIERMARYLGMRGDR